MANYTMNLYEVVQRLADKKNLRGWYGNENEPINHCEPPLSVFPVNYSIGWINNFYTYYLPNDFYLYASNGDKINLESINKMPCSSTDRGFKYLEDYDKVRFSMSLEKGKKFYNKSDLHLATFRDVKATEYHVFDRPKYVRSTYIDHLEQKILLHYWMREIGTETIDEFIVIFRQLFTEKIQELSARYSNLFYVSAIGPKTGFDSKKVANYTPEEPIPYIEGGILRIGFDASTIEELFEAQGEYYDGDDSSTESGTDNEEYLSNTTRHEAGANTDKENSSNEAKTRHMDTPYSSLPVDNSKYSSDQNYDFGKGESSSNRTNVSDTSISNTNTGKKSNSNKNEKSSKTMSMNLREGLRNITEAQDMLSKIEDELIEALEPAFLQIF